MGEVQAKGAALVPKRALEVMDGEVNRILLLGQNCIVPISFQVPRKVIFLLTITNVGLFLLQFILV